MNTITVTTQISLLHRVKTFASALKIALKVAAESTTPSDVSNPLRPSLRDQAPAQPDTTGQIVYRDCTICIGQHAQDYCVVFPDGRVRYGSVADIKGDIDAWFTGASFAARLRSITS